MHARIFEGGRVDLTQIIWNFGSYYFLKKKNLEIYQKYVQIEM